MFRNALIDVVVALVVLELAAMGAVAVSQWMWCLAVLAVAWPVWSERRREQRRRPAPPNGEPTRQRSTELLQSRRDA